MFYVIYIYEHYISISHIAVSGYGTASRDIKLLYTDSPTNMGINSRGVAANVPNCDNIVSKFEIQSSNYFYFRTYTIEEMYEHPHPF